MDNKEMFQIKRLSFSYNEKPLIENLTCSLKKGMITTFIGANGCGKSTLFHLLTKNLKPIQGNLFLYGKQLQDIHLKDFAKKVAIVHQYNTAPMDLTVEKLVAYGRTPYYRFGRDKDSKKSQEKIKWALEITQTWKYKDRCVSELSGGQKQRVWIAMALAQDTEILFLDEPTTYLDIRYQLQILQLIKKLNREYGITIVMVLHDMNQALYYSDEIIAMKEGKIVAQGTPQDVITKELIHDIYQVDLTITKFDDKPFVIPV